MPQGAQVQSSESDHRKFYVVVGDQYLRMRAESRCLSRAWCLLPGVQDTS